METNSALQELNDAADLVAMVEELINGQRLTPAALAGIKVSLRSIHRTLVSSKIALSGPATSSTSTIDAPVAKEQMPSFEASAQSLEPKLDLTEPDRMVLKRKDLRASIERIVER